MASLWDSWLIFLLSVCVGAILCLYAAFHIALWVALKILRAKYIPPKRVVRKIAKLPKEEKQEAKDNANHYDVIIVGGGPAGGVCGYYSAKAGLKTAVLERKQFPRDKYCGNAVCVPALRILDDMKLLQEMKRDDQITLPDVGGFVTPGGDAFIGRSVEEVGEPLSGAVKRIILDEKIIKRAVEQGLILKEGFEVKQAVFDSDGQTWKVTSASGVCLTADVLVACDGAQSNLARELGYVTEAPEGISTRCYVAAGTHNAQMDGMVVYPPFSLPGYCALFRHPKDELNFCYYLIPCGPQKGQLGDVTARDLPSLHEYALKNDPFISKALGPNARIEPMRVAPLRVALQGVKSTYGDNFLLCGDAAGFIDPLTGEGIHSAMMSGRDAALTLIEMHKANNFSSTACAQYEDRWFNSFGYDFEASKDASWLLWKCPFILDASCELMHKSKNVLFSKWAKVMTMFSGKELLLEHDFAAKMTYTCAKILLRKLVASFFMPEFNSSYPGKWNRAKAG